MSLRESALANRQWATAVGKVLPTHATCEIARLRPRGEGSPGRGCDPACGTCGFHLVEAFDEDQVGDLLDDLERLRALVIDRLRAP